MRTITTGVNAVDKFLGKRVCFLLVFVFFCAIDRSSTTDATTGRSTGTLSFRRPGTLTDEQRRSAVTIEFNFSGIDRKNRTALEIAYRDVRRKFLDFLNRRKYITASPTYSTKTASNTIAVVYTTAIIHTTTSTTTIITTSTAPTTNTATLGTFSPRMKRKRRNSGGNNDTFTEDDLPFVYNDPEFDENGNLRISLIIDKEGCVDLDLYEIAIALNRSGLFETVAPGPVVKIYRGLPAPDEISFRHPRTLTDEQWRSTVTIEFNLNHIDRKNRAAVEVAYREVRRTFIEYLNRRKSTTASPRYSTRSGPNTLGVIVVFAVAAATTTTTAITTPTTPTTTAATTMTTDPSSKRRKRHSERENDKFTEDDLHFVRNDPEYDENGNLRISLFIDKEGFDDLDLFQILNELIKYGEFKEIAPVVNIYRGLPRQLPVNAAVHVDYRVWLPILLAIILLFIIFIFVYCWKAKNKKSIGAREINSSVGGLMTERMDTLQESRGRQQMDFPLHEICATSSNEKETKEQIVMEN